MNQVCFTTFHMAMMGCAGHVLGKVIQVNPKLVAIAGITSSILFQLLSEVFDSELENALNSEYPDPRKKLSTKQIMRDRLSDRNFSNFVIPLLAVSGVFKDSNRSIRKHIIQWSFVVLALSLTSYLAAKAGAYYFLKERDFSLFGRDRDPVW